MSRQTIERFYAAFAQLDSATMAACYASDAHFDDEAFSLRGREQIGGMWTMLCDAVKAKGRDVWKLEASAITDRSAHWEPTYNFSATGRTVHNIIHAHFRFADGLIVEHVDDFDFWRWSRQALGPAGRLLGWTPLLRNRVRREAARTLDRFVSAQTP